MAGAAPIAEGGFPIAQELLDEVAEATAQGKKAATDDEIKAEGTDGKDPAGDAAPPSKAAAKSGPETPPAAAAP